MTKNLTFGKRKPKLKLNRQILQSQWFLPKKELFCDIQKIPVTKEGIDVCVQLRAACSNLLIAV